VTATATQGRNQNSADNDPAGWREEGKALLRAVAGGAIVGMPLLFTMEMWSHGLMFNEWHLLGILAASLCVNFLFSLVSGFRREYSVPEAVSESLSAVAIGLVFSTAILWIIGELGHDQAPIEAIGKVVIEAAVVSLGVSFANSQVVGRSRTAENEVEGAGGKGAEASSDKDEDPERRQLKADLADAGATIAGSVVFALNIAPTDEVIVIASHVGPWQQLGMLAASMLLCYVILYASGFEKHQVHVEGLLQKPPVEALMATALSLAVAAALLVLLGNRELLADPSILIAGIITLGMPAVIGGAAGRLIV
jgi:putative integral membrane protein (TIGR02587 family)